MHVSLLFSTLQVNSLFPRIHVLFFILHPCWLDYIYYEKYAISKQIPLKNPSNLRANFCPEQFPWQILANRGLFWFLYQGWKLKPASIFNNAERTRSSVLTRGDRPWSKLITECSQSN